MDTNTLTLPVAEALARELVSRGYGQADTERLQQVAQLAAKLRKEGLRSDVAVAAACHQADFNEGTIEVLHMFLFELALKQLREQAEAAR
jgi:hypothetical protein